MRADWLSAPLARSHEDLKNLAATLKQLDDLVIMDTVGSDELEESDAGEFVPFWIRLGIELPEPTAFEARCSALARLAFTTLHTVARARARRGHCCARPAH